MSKIRYRQADQLCTVSAQNNGSLLVRFDEKQLDVTPGQFIVFYKEERCLGGAVIKNSIRDSSLGFKLS